MLPSIKPCRGLSLELLPNEPGQRNEDDEPKRERHHSQRHQAKGD